MHVEKNFAERSVSVFSGSEIQFVPADDGLLRIASASSGMRRRLARYRTITRSVIFSAPRASRRGFPLLHHVAIMDEALSG